ncbi:hypothetical protein [Streptomyces sp. NPDC002265]|uniref:hypothetical protein n=1 Tax=Streptomyces sp. NPDC002265 TaxID=3154415 RepID=UPI0033200D86
MSTVVSLVVAGLALAVSAFGSYVAWLSLETARNASRAGHIQNLFTANQAALQYPELLIDVHGIDPALPLREARALVYLSILLDGFQVAHGRHHRGDYAQMAELMKREGDSLRRVLAIPKNAERWPIVRDHSYGDFDQGFIAAIDDLIAHERNLAARGTTNTA